MGRPLAVTIRSWPGPFAGGRVSEWRTFHFVAFAHPVPFECGPSTTLPGYERIHRL
jgi:hypothetical protein